MFDDSRVAWAWIGAPVVALLTAGVAASLIGFIGIGPAPNGPWIAAAVGAMAAFLLLGAPIAYALETLVALCACRFVRPRRGRGVGAVALAALLAGFLAFAGLAALLFHQCGRVFCGAVVGAVGALAGDIVWWLGLRRSDRPVTG